MRMIQNWKYEARRSASGWGIREKGGHKVRGFGNRNIDRFTALKYMYALYVWNWNRSKYVRQDPTLATWKFRSNVNPGLDNKILNKMQNGEVVRPYSLHFVSMKGRVSEGQLGPEQAGASLQRLSIIGRIR